MNLPNCLYSQRAMPSDRHGPLLLLWNRTLEYERIS